MKLIEPTMEYDRQIQRYRQEFWSTTGQWTDVARFEDSIEHRTGWIRFNYSNARKQRLRILCR